MAYIFTFNQNACDDCKGKCCNGEKGNIWVNKNEITAIAAFLGIETKKFISSYLLKKGYRYSIKELKTGKNYACLFFDTKKNGCGIYDVRPEQCKTYPFWPFFKDHPEVVIEECIGIVLKTES
jgi:Fe-S-cluster containining protein